MKKIIAILLTAVLTLAIATSIAADEVVYETEMGVSLQKHVTNIIDGTFTNGTENYDNVFDGDVKSKWCGGAGPDGTYNVSWKMDKEYSILGYAIATANDNESCKGRNPDSWILYGSNDGENWEIVHEVYYDEILQDVNFTYYDISLEAPSAPYRYWKYEILELEVAGCMQISEICLIADAAQVEGVPEVETVFELPRQPHNVDFGEILSSKTSLISQVSSAAPAEGAGNLFDDRTDTKWCGGTPNEDGSYEVVFQLDAAHEITGYALATANDTEPNPGRNPKSWTLYGSNDGENWDVIDYVEEDTKLEGTNFTYYEYPLAEKSAAYTTFKYVIHSLVVPGCMQISSLNLYGYLPAAEEVVETPVEEVVETPVAEAPVAEAPVVAAPQTFDVVTALVLTAVAAFGGVVVSKKRQ